MRIDEIILNLSGRDFSILDKDEVFDRNKVRELVEELKKSLVNDINPGDRVALIIDNSIQFILSIMAISSLGATSVLIDIDTPVQVINDYLEMSNASLVITTKELNSHFSHYGESEFIVGNSKYLKIKLNDNHMHHDIDPEEAFILFSSGTTGVSKGIILKHESVICNINSIISYMRPKPEDKFYVTRTMVYVSSLIGEVLVSLFAGSKLVVSNPKISPRSTLKLLAEHQVTIIGVNPTVLDLLVKTSRLSSTDLSSIRSVYVSGAVAKRDLLLDAEKVFSNARIYNVYGLTEAGFRVSAQREDGFNDYGSVGIPLDGVQVKIVDGGGIECDPYFPGEVYVKTPSLMKGYLSNKHSLKEKVENGWLKTNDEGYLDEHGQLYISGRKDEMINKFGFNVDPFHVENIVSKFSGIKESIVFGINDKKTNHTTIVCAYVCDSDLNSQNITPKVLNTFCRNHLKQVEVPNVWTEWKELPRTHTGKVSRHMAKEKFSREEL